MVAKPLFARGVCAAVSVDAAWETTVKTAKATMNKANLF